MNILLDLFIIYLACGAALIAFLQHHELYFFTNSAYEDGAPNKSVNKALSILMFLINISIITTSIAAWPLVLISCLNFNPQEDE